MTTTRSELESPTAPEQVAAPGDLLGSVLVDPETALEREEDIRIRSTVAAYWNLHDALRLSRSLSIWHDDRQFVVVRIDRRGAWTALFLVVETERLLCERMLRTWQSATKDTSLVAVHQLGRDLLARARARVWNAAGDITIPDRYTHAAEFPAIA
jgi:hypothetical protein